MGNKKRKVLPKTATIANDSVSTKNATVVSGNTCADAGTAKVAIPPTSAKKAGISKTATMADGNVSTNQATVVPDIPQIPVGIQKIAASPTETIAKVTKNLDCLYLLYMKLPNRTHGFITNLARALQLKRHEASQYGSFVLPNGNNLTIRVSNHNARTSTFDKHGEREGVSLVISSFPNRRIKNDGVAHITEVFYRQQYIERSVGRPLLEIINSIKLLLATGEYKDTTGLAERQEVNL